MSEDTPPPAPREREEREKIAGGIVGAAGCIAALLISGWFGDPISPPVGLAFAVVGGVLAGLITAGSRDERLANGAAGVVAAVTMVFATAWYIEGRRSIVRVELLVPMAIGAAVGYVALLVLRKLPGQGLRRAATFALPALLLVIVGARLSVAPPAAPPPRPDTASARGATIEILGRDALRDQLGPKATTLFSKVDVLNSMLAVYGPKVLQNPAGQKTAAEVRRAAAELRDEVNRRIAAGAPASDFDDFADVERRIAAVLGPPPAAP